MQVLFVWLREIKLLGKVLPSLQDLIVNLSYTKIKANYVQLLIIINRQCIFTKESRFISQVKGDSMMGARI